MKMIKFLLLPETMQTQFTDAYMRQQGEMIEANPFEIRNSLVRNSSGDIVKLWSPYSIWRQHDPFTQLKDES